MADVLFDGNQEEEIKELSGKLIVIEGLDGAGKSTQVNLIKKYLEDNNKSTIHIHFW
jgi:dTMP kinase